MCGGYIDRQYTCDYHCLSDQTSRIYPFVVTCYLQESFTSTETADLKRYTEICVVHRVICGGIQRNTMPTTALGQVRKAKDIALSCRRYCRRLGVSCAVKAD